MTSKISGVIDSITRSQSGGSAYDVSGWCSFRSDTEGLKSADHFEFINIDTYNFMRVRRLDFKDAPDIGFRFTVKDLRSLARLYWGDASVVARSDGLETKLALFSSAKLAAAKLIVGEMVDRHEEIKGSGGVTIAFPALDPPDQKTRAVSSEAQLQVGAMNVDKTAIVGHSGYIFLFGGSNNLNAQYHKSNVTSKSSDWVELIRARSNFSRELDIHYIHSTIPEKQSIMCKQYPGQIDGPTPLFSEIEKELCGTAPYVSAFNVLKTAQENFREPYRKVDTHLSFNGAFEVVKAMLRGFNLEINLGDPRLLKTLIGGDLGGKFLHKGGLLEWASVPDERSWDFAKISTNLISHKKPEFGHMGTQMEWSTDKPLIDAKCLIFGDSNFERGYSSLGSGPIDLALAA